MAPTHFFGELTKTPEGCRYLREKDLVAELAEIVRLHGMESVDQVVMTNVKSVLWALVSVYIVESLRLELIITGSSWLESWRTALLGG